MENTITKYNAELNAFKSWESLQVINDLQDEIRNLADNLTDFELFSLIKRNRQTLDDLLKYKSFINLSI